MNISVVVCTYNRKELLCKAVDSLIHQQTHGKFTYEIVVIDDGSTDGTDNLIKEIIENTDKIPMRYVYNTGGGIADARNRGIDESCGKWLAFFDDDQWAEPEWLVELYKVALEKRADCVGGTVLPDSGDLAGLELSPLCLVCLPQLTFCENWSQHASNRLPGTGNVLIRKELFESIGGFDARIRYGGEDTDFFWRARKHGALIWYAPKAVVHHKIFPWRLSHDYFRHRSLRHGLENAWLRYRYNGRLRVFLGLGRQVFRTLARDVWLLGIAILLSNKSQKLDRKCRLWLTIGYVRGTISIFAPSLFSQKRFFDSLDFRTRRLESARDNPPKGKIT